MRPFEPGLSGKVDGLRTIVANIVTGVVTVRIGYYKLALIMNKLVDLDPVLLLQNVGRDEVCLVTQELAAILGVQRPDLPHGCLELPRVFL